ncbi:MAG: glycogen/starch/alpha-glucan phosphorylase [Candidatus Obscuribacterales bacterium]|nr:glycogen/starch/alpha-glucan phosphorylase [Candidatus Obscuribacterales bacterium]
MADKPTERIIVEDDRTGLSVETLRRAMADNLYYVQGKLPQISNDRDFYMALSYTVRDRLLARWLNTLQTYLRKEVRVVCYFSAEFLIGPQLENNMVNMDIYEKVKEATEESGLDFAKLLEVEEEPGLGNGGLGRLAACYLDSLATLRIPAIGYGIRYEFGIFDQEIRDGWQTEISDKWLRYGNPWEIPRLQRVFRVKLGGHTEKYTDERGRFKVAWVPERVINGVPYDTPVSGYKNNTANTLRLWKAESPESFDFLAFNAGDYSGAVEDKIVSENISKVLYPNDNVSQGKRLRLEQQYFFVSCSLQDMIRFHLDAGMSIATFASKFAVQLNDTHPSIAIPELMRLLMDEHGEDWDTAWKTTVAVFAYTNHTLLPEALERWPVSLMSELLPRHIEIIYEINRRFLDTVRHRFPGDEDLVRRLSIIDESGERYVRMAHLACVGSHSINGVAALHTELMKKDVLHDFNLISPEKFSNKTNGITPRRFMVVSNPELSKLIDSKIGNEWVSKLDELKKLEKFIDDKQFQEDWRAVKLRRKEILSRHINETCGVRLDPHSMFDVHAKRLHEYKRQHLNVLHIIRLYNQLKKNPKLDIYPPRSFIFAGKAAPGYYLAKLIIKLINSVADVVNDDRDIDDRLKVVFIPDFTVKLAQKIYPAAELSEQISTAGKEASGTGNMKFALNGALTIGTLDGANIEMREDVGADNFFLFGLTAEEVAQRKAQGYNPYDFYLANPELKEVIDLISSGHFSHGDKELFRPIVDALLGHDDYMLLADFDSYVECQDQVGQAYKDVDRWTRMSMLNVARMGKFSSDRSVREYCKEIWKVESVDVELPPYSQPHAVLKV